MYYGQKESRCGIVMVSVILFWEILGPGIYVDVILTPVAYSKTVNVVLVGSDQ